MSISPRLSPSLNQRLTLAPRLSEALKLLALPTIELAHALEQALEANVMLERVELEEDTQNPSEDTAAEDPDNTEAWGRLDWSSTPTPTNSAQFPEAAEPVVDLRHYLIDQLALERFSVRDHAIALVVIDALDEDGYLREPTAALATAVKPLAPHVNNDEIEAVIHRIQHLDPSGIAARSPRECLLVQLADKSDSTPGLGTARHLVNTHFDALAHDTIMALARLAEATLPETETAFNLILSLDPHPGYRLGAAQPEYLIPELLAHRESNGWRVELNPAASPRLQINENYTAWLSAHRRNEGAETLTTQLEEARWLVRSLAQRQETLVRVGNVLVTRQADFLEHGPARLVPMVLRNVADELGIHESTVSRAVQGKALATTRGIIPLRYFFSTAVSQGDGKTLSARAIQQRLRGLIAAEDPAAPFSDAALMQALAQEDTHLARRTVAKYREALGIASARERKRPGRQGIHTATRILPASVQMTPTVER